MDGQMTHVDRVVEVDSGGNSDDTISDTEIDALGPTTTAQQHSQRQLGRSRSMQEEAPVRRAPVDMSALRPAPWRSPSRRVRATSVVAAGEYRMQRAAAHGSAHASRGLTRHSAPIGSHGSIRTAWSGDGGAAGVPEDGVPAHPTQPSCLELVMEARWFVCCCTGDCYAIALLIVVLGAAGIAIVLVGRGARLQGDRTVAIIIGGVCFMLSAGIAALYVVYLRRRRHREGKLEPLPSMASATSTLAKATSHKYMVQRHSNASFGSGSGVPTPKARVSDAYARAVADTVCYLCHNPLDSLCTRDHSWVQERRETALRRASKRGSDAAGGSGGADGGDSGGDGDTRSRRLSRAAYEASICPIAMGVCGHSFHFHCITAYAKEQRLKRVNQAADDKPTPCPIGPWVWNLDFKKMGVSKARLATMAQEFEGIQRAQRLNIAPRAARVSDASPATGSTSALSSSLSSAYGARLAEMGSRASAGSKRSSRRSMKSMGSKRVSATSQDEFDVEMGVQRRVSDVRASRFAYSYSFGNDEAVDGVFKANLDYDMHLGSGATGSRRDSRRKSKERRKSRDRRKSKDDRRRSSARDRSTSRERRRSSRRSMSRRDSRSHHKGSARGPRSSTVEAVHL